MSNLRKNNLELYNQHAADWWNSESRAFRSLQNINQSRFENIKRFCLPNNPGMVADLGCGGGLLAIPILDLGHQVTGVDLSAASIAAAQNMAKNRGTFLVGDIRQTKLPSAYFDSVLLSDILEHLPDIIPALEEAYRILKPAGRMYVSTLNKTFISYVAAILLGEGLGYVPRGTHDWKLFITPSRLIAESQAMGFKLNIAQGEQVEIGKTLFGGKIFVRNSPHMLVSYWTVFEKGTTHA
ncbi:MAG: 3-demethylubiquinone-9 3-O-methyltransferase [Bdellovibrionales bacterium]|nr:3-demethylubiquinone-9 3-O-methyltransferase [Bdellovibrionales bacterium]